MKVPEQALSREAIYEEPPSIMVTNTTMLEYMLIRRKDAPIIEKSQGMLKYIVWMKPIVILVLRLLS